MPGSTGVSLQCTWRMPNGHHTPKFRANSTDWDSEGVWYLEDSKMEAIVSGSHCTQRPLQTKYLQRLPFWEGSGALLRMEN